MAPRLKIGKVGSAESAARKAIASVDGQPGRPVVRTGSGDRPPRILAVALDGIAADRRAATRPGSGSGA